MKTTATLSTNGAVTPSVLLSANQVIELIASASGVRPFSIVLEQPTLADQVREKTVSRVRRDHARGRAGTASLAMFSVVDDYRGQMSAAVGAASQSRVARSRND